MRMSAKARYAKLRAANLCGRCGRLPALRGASRCGYCRDEQNAALKPPNKSQQARRNAQSRKLVARWRAEGRCITCGQPSEGYTRCAVCRQKNATAKAESKRRKQAAK